MTKIPNEPIAHLVWLQGRRAADDVEDYYEVARPGDKSVDGSDPFPVYVALPHLAKPVDAERHERAIPDGWQLVPKQLNGEMIEQLQMYTEIGSYICANWAGAYHCMDEYHEKMLAAAPPPPAAVQEPVAVKGETTSPVSSLGGSAVALATLISERMDYNLRSNDLWSDAAKDMAKHILAKPQPFAWYFRGTFPLEANAKTAAAISFLTQDEREVEQSAAKACFESFEIIPLFVTPTPAPREDPAPEIAALRAENELLGYANVYRIDGALELGSADIDNLEDVEPWAKDFEEHVGIAEIRLLPNTEGKSGSEVRAAVAPQQGEAK
ncbi:hypothetical protein G6L30_17090 [Agrobacterium rhizogenes]|nr:hypothetical protein [Rhizobium rhizogenes]